MDSSLSPAVTGDVLAPPLGIELSSAQREAIAFWRMRWRIARTLLSQTFQQAWLRLVLVLALSSTLWLGLFVLCVDGFQFLNNTIAARDTYDLIIRAMFGMFFVSLMLMLVFSTGLILYSSLFRSPEAAFLLATPAREERIFLHRFQEAVLFGSWGFLLLGSPMLFAYGIVAAAPWYYYLMLVPFMAAFIYIPSSIGAVACLAIVRWLPRRRLSVAVGGLIAALALLAAAGFFLVAGGQANLLTPDWFEEFLGRLRFTEQRLLPSWWLTSGLTEAANHEWSESVLFLSLLISNALFARHVALWIAARCYRRAYQVLACDEGPRKRVQPWWIDESLPRARRLLPKPMALLLVKDFRLFRRDPVQWSQFFIFFGLLALYFFNIRRFSYDFQYVGWMNMVSFLNLSVVGLLLSTFNTRFIFPMISLEGMRFWVLGLLPVKRDTILWGKFCFAFIGSLLPSSTLVALSDLMLGVSPVILVSHQITCVLLSMGLSGIAVGLGARFPNLRQQSPSRIAAGFGGTLNLVVSTMFIVAVVLLTAVPCHFYFSGLGAGRGPAVAASLRWYLGLWLTLGTIGSIILSAAATIAPLRMGMRAFRRLEF